MDFSWVTVSLRTIIAARFFVFYINFNFALFYMLGWP